MRRPIIRPARDEETEAFAALSVANGLDAGGPAVTMTGAHVRAHPPGPRPLSILRMAEGDGCLAGFFITARLVHGSLRAACLRRGVDEGDEAAAAFYISLGAASEGAFEGRILAGAACETLAAEAEA